MLSWLDDKWKATRFLSILVDIGHTTLHYTTAVAAAQVSVEER